AGQQLDQGERREHVGLVYAAQLAKLVLAQRWQRAGTQRACVIDQYVETAEPADSSREVGTVAGARDVAGDRGDTGVPAVGVGEIVFPPRVRDHRPAAVGKRAGGRSAESPGRSGYQGD